jgi:hypothetical protein
VQLIAAIVDLPEALWRNRRAIESDAGGPAMKTLRGFGCLVGAAMIFAGCAYTVEIAQPAANATVPPGAPVSFVVNIHNADGRSFGAEMDGAAIPATDFTFNLPPPTPPGPFYPSQATLSRSLPPGSHTFRASANAAQPTPWSVTVIDAQVAFTVAPWSVEVRPLSCLQSQAPGTAEIQVGLLNVGTGSVAAPFTVSFESVTVSGQPVPDLSFNVPFDLLQGPPVDVPAHGVWVVTAASGAQIAGTINVRQANVAIASPRPRACQVP